MAARNARVRKPPEKYVPTLKGNKYAVALTQITKSLKKSKHELAQMSVNVDPLNPGHGQTIPRSVSFTRQHSTRAIVALVNNLGIVYHQYCSSSYQDYPANPGSSYCSRQWKSSSNFIPTRPPELQLQSQLPTDSDESAKAPSTLNSPLPTLLL